MPFLLLLLEASKDDEYDQVKGGKGCRVGTNVESSECHNAANCCWPVGDFKIGSWNDKPYGCFIDSQRVSSRPYTVYFNENSTGKCVDFGEFECTEVVSFCKAWMKKGRKSAGYYGKVK